MPKWIKWCLLPALLVGVLIAAAAVLGAAWLLRNRLDWRNQSHAVLLVEVAVAGASAGKQGEDGATPIASSAAMDRDAIIEQTIAVIAERLRALGIKGDVRRETPGSNRILIRHAGAANGDRVKNWLLRRGRLELRLVVSGPHRSQDEVLDQHEGKLQPNLEIVDSEIGSEDGAKLFVLEREPVVTTGDITKASADTEQYGGPTVLFTLGDDGARRLGACTTRNIGRRLAIVLDGTVKSAPVISAEIREQGVITGNFTVEEVRDLAAVLSAGELPVTVRLLEERMVDSAKR